jgi:hypothetical protein
MVEMIKKTQEVFDNFEDDGDVRQSCMYLYSIYAEFVEPAAMMPVMPKMLKQIETIITAPDMHDNEIIVLTEQAVSALGQMIVFHRENNLINDNIVVKFVSLLPLKAEENEA